MLTVQNLSVKVDSTYILRDISFEIPESGITGLLGESGSGKSVFSKTVSGLLTPPLKKTDGKIFFKGRELITSKDFASVRGGGISMIFQHPTSALNPVFTVGEQLAETILFHNKGLDEKRARERARELLEKTGIEHPAERLNAYPHQLSGGMNQRVMIALALATKPSLLIADEPTTALDVLIQKQIVEEIIKLSDEEKFAVLFITHNIKLIERAAQKTLIFYAGELIEELSTDALKLGHIKHPCAAALKKCLPSVDDTKRDEPLPTIKGVAAKNNEVYDNRCVFAERCDSALPRCFTEKPVFKNGVKCFFY